MKFVCLGFFDETKFVEIPQAEAQRMMEECFAYDDTNFGAAGISWAEKRSIPPETRSR